MNAQLSPEDFKELEEIHPAARKMHESLFCTGVKIEFDDLFLRCIPYIHGRRPQCFWAGLEGRKRAHQEKDHLTDDQVPVIRMLFRMLSLIRKNMKKHDPQMTELSFMVSRVFAYYSGGTAKIFISQDKSTEEPGYTTGTNLWEAELPMLWELLHLRILDDIHIHLFRNGSWDGPFSIRDERLDFPIWRRNFHKLDAPDTKLSFVEQHYAQDDYDRWRTQPPRRGIMLSSLKRMIARWKRSCKK